MSYRNSNDSGKVFGACLGLVLLFSVVPLFNAWWGMLLAGALHHEVSEKIPAFGYWQMLWIVLAITFAGSLFRGLTNSKEKK